MNELIQILIKSQCLEYALNLMETHKDSIDFEYFKSYLLLYGKYTTTEVNDDIQDKFLNFYKSDLVSLVFAELYSSAFANWNSVLCQKLIGLFGMEKIAKKLNEKNVDLISLCFKKLIYDGDLPDQMKKLIEMMIIENHQEINVLGNYPILEKSEAIVKFSFLSEHDPNRFSVIKYSPLIIAIITKCHNTVNWLLNLKVNDKYVIDINFADSKGRHPIMHAIFNNDLKIFNLLLNIDILQLDTQCLQYNFKNTNQNIKILKRDINKMTVFHYLISPFEFGNFYKADLIFHLLWELLDSEEKTDELIIELSRYASEKNASNIIQMMKKKNIFSNQIQSNHLNQNHSILNNQNVNNVNHFKNDYEEFYKSHLKDGDKNLNVIDQNPLKK